MKAMKWKFESDTKQPRLEMMCDGKDLFLILDGTRIAKRGHPGTPQAKTWVSLGPWSVTDIGDMEEIVVEWEGVRVH